MLIAGKGHEKYQVIGSQVLPFDDVAVAREALGRTAQQLRCRVAPMLYHLLYPFRTAVLGAERDALHHVPHGGGEPVGAGDQPACSGRG